MEHWQWYWAEIKGANKHKQGEGERAKEVINGPHLPRKPLIFTLFMSIASRYAFTLLIRKGGNHYVDICRYMYGYMHMQGTH